MSLTKQEEFEKSDIPAGDRKTANLFFSVDCIRRKVASYMWLKCYKYLHSKGTYGKTMCKVRGNLSNNVSRLNRAFTNIGVPVDTRYWVV